MRSGILLMIAVACILVTEPPAGGQGPIQFDAATIKLDERGPGDMRLKGGPGTDSPGRVTWQKSWLLDMLAKAFHLNPENVSGPDWIAFQGAQLYSLTATMPPDTSEHDFELMLQRFLIEQFQIKFHHEPRNFPAYDLVVAQRGAKLIRSADQSADPNAPVRLIASQMKVDSDGFLPLPPGHGVVSTYNHGYWVTFQDYLMPQFAEFLNGRVTPPEGPHTYVTDKTGLTGLYDFKLKYDPGSNDIKFGPALAAAGGATPGTDPTGLPGIFKAVEQQLGLKLVKAAARPMDTIVIDHAERIPLGN